jgi:thymidylate synthase
MNNSVDCHIYKNHIEGVLRTLNIHIKLDESLKKQRLVKMEFSYFGLIGYFSHPGIKMIMVI